MYCSTIRPILALSVFLATSPSASLGYAAPVKTAAGSPADDAVQSTNAAKDGVRPISSRVSEVTLFGDRAIVVRTGKLELRPGETRAAFDRLPAQLDVNSVQVRGRGAAMIKGVNIRAVEADAAHDPEIRRLTNAKLSAQAKVQAKQDQIGQARKEKEFIEGITKKLTTATENSGAAELDPKKWIEMVAFYRKRLAALDQEMRVAEQELIGLQESLTAAEEALQKVLGGGGQRYQAVVWLESASGGTAELEVEYLVLGPRWYPRYEVRADSKKGKVNLIYQGMVVQDTGEDWERVSLVLSTAQPQAGNREPELGPWNVQPYQPRPVPQAYPGRSVRPASQAKASMARSAAPSMAMAEEAYQAPMAVAQAEVVPEANALVYSLRGPQTVRSDGQPSSTTIMIREFPASFEYSSVPKLAAQVFLQAKLKNDSDFALLPGETGNYLDNNYVSNGTIQRIAPAEEFQVNLGADPGIKIQHKLINRVEDKSGLLADKVKFNYEYLIKIENRKVMECKIKVRDHVPLSGHADIVTDLIEPKLPEPGGGPVKKDEQNLLEWNLTLAPGETVKLPVKFGVTYPKQMRVEGL